MPTPDPSQSLLTSEGFLRLVLDTFPLIVFWKDRDSVYLGCNQNFADDTGFASPDEIIGLTDYDMPWAQTEADLYRANDTAVMESGNAMLGIMETRMNAQGERTWLETNKAPLRDKEGNIIGVLGTYQDITKRVTAEEQNRIQAYILQNLFDAVISTDMSLVVNSWNRAAETLYGYTAEEVIGKPVGDFITSRYEDVLPGDGLKFLLAHEHYTGRTFQEVRNGRRFMIEASTSLVRDEQGKPNQIVAINRDVSELYEAEQALKQYSEHLEEMVEKRTQALQQALDNLQVAQAELTKAKERAETANQAKSEFLSNMSHELRTPLNGILGYAQILQRSQLTTKQQDGVAVIEKSGQHLLTLIGDILDIAKIEARKLSLQASPTVLSNLLESITGMVRIQAQQKSLKFNYKTVGDFGVAVLADAKRLRQVLLNLLSNGVKFTHTGHVGLSVKDVTTDSTPAEHIEVLFEITDTGAGIASEDIERIFQPFEQLDSPHMVDGTGLGLAISWRIIEAMGSEIVVNSVLHKGSSFSFALLLPLVSTTTALLRTTPDFPSITGYSGPRRKVLVVDDVEYNRRVLHGLLAPLGFEVVEGVDGDDAITMAQSVYPDIILIDLVMPRKTGFEAVQILRQQLEFMQTPIIALSASVLEEDKKSSLIAGCDAFLPKPIQAEALFDELAVQLQLTWLQDEAKGDVEVAKSTVTVPKNMTLPPPEALQSLRQLTLLGDLNALREALLALEAETAELAPFVQQMVALANDFEDEAILVLLDGYLTA